MLFSIKMCYCQYLLIFSAPWHLIFIFKVLLYGCMVGFSCCYWFQFVYAFSDICATSPFSALDLCRKGKDCILFLSTMTFPWWVFKNRIHFRTHWHLINIIFLKAFPGLLKEKSKSTYYFNKISFHSKKA